MKQLTNEEYKSRMLGIMLAIDRICRENGFRYSIVYGTLLGAIRHRGFIPWDDDMDIAMTRSDYGKLRDYVCAHPELGLNFIDISTRPDTIYMCGKVCDAATCVRESNYRSVKGYGAFVDVFLLDSLPDDEKERREFKARARYLARLVQHSSKRRPGRPQGLRHALLLYGAFAYAHLFSTNRLIRKLDALCAKYDDVQTEYVGVPYFISYFKRSDFDELIELPFEGHMLIGPKNYENILNASYENYRELPPPEKRVTHNVACFWRE